jgi:hypothetical protein
MAGQRVILQHGPHPHLKRNEHGPDDEKKDPELILYVMRVSKHALAGILEAMNWSSDPNVSLATAAADAETPLVDVGGEAS